MILVRAGKWGVAEGGEEAEVMGVVVAKAAEGSVEAVEAVEVKGEYGVGMLQVRSEQEQAKLVLGPRSLVLVIPRTQTMADGVVVVGARRTQALR